MSFLILRLSTKRAKRFEVECAACLDSAEISETAASSLSSRVDIFTSHADLCF